MGSNKTCARTFGRDACAAAICKASLSFACGVIFGPMIGLYRHSTRNQSPFVQMCGLLGMPHVQDVATFPPLRLARPSPELQLSFQRAVWFLIPLIHGAPVALNKAYSEQLWEVHE